MPVAANVVRLRFRSHLRLLRREVRPTFALALPMMAGMVAQMLVGLVDTLMVGRVGVVPLAAASFVNAIAHLPLVFGMGLLSSIAVLTAQTFGARQMDETGEVLRHGIAISAGMGFIAMLLVFGLHPLLGRLGQPPEVVAQSGNYIFLYGASLFPALIAHGCKQFSDALKHPWTPTLIMLMGVALTIGFNWLLIYGHWGFPALGLEGAGWSTLLSRLLMAVAMVAYTLRTRALRMYQPRRWRMPLTRARLNQLFALGWPVAAQHLLEVGAFAFAAVMMGWISADAIAAHQIAITCAAMTFMFGMGIGGAICIRVGHAYGAGQFARMRRIGFAGIGMSACVMGSFGVLFMTAGEPIARLFIDAPAVVQLTGQMLVVAAVFQVADGVQVVSMSALRGLADVRAPAMIAVAAYWVLALPLGTALAFGARFGAVGIWIGLAAGLGAAAFSLTWRFHLKTLHATGSHHAPRSTRAAFPEHGSLP